MGFRVQGVLGSPTTLSLLPPRKLRGNLGLCSKPLTLNPKPRGSKGTQKEQNVQPWPTSEVPYEA